MELTELHSIGSHLSGHVLQDGTDTAGSIPGNHASEARRYRDGRKVRNTADIINDTSGTQGNSRGESTERKGGEDGEGTEGEHFERNVGIVVSSLELDEKELT